MNSDEYLTNALEDLRSDIQAMRREFREDLQALNTRIQKSEEKFVLQTEFAPIKTAVYTVITAIVLAILGGGMNLLMVKQ